MSIILPKKIEVEFDLLFFQLFEGDFKAAFYTIYLVLERHWHLVQLSRMYVFLIIHL